MTAQCHEEGGPHRRKRAWSEHSQTPGQRMGAKLLCEIPYEERLTEAQIQRKTLLECADCAAEQLIRSLWVKTCRELSF